VINKKRKTVKNDSYGTISTLFALRSSSIISLHQCT